MRKFNNPLDNIHVGSPCSADWDEMFGDERKRHCGDCKMNVYNLSDMTRREAESLLINSEGRLCVRFFRRSDGTVLTKNCPVGWRAAKQRVSRVATAAFSAIAGLITGVIGYNVLQRQEYAVSTGVVSVMGDTEVTQGEISPAPNRIDMDIDRGIYMNGRMTLGKPVIVVKPNTAIKLEPTRK
jgi:hypothetical protein